MVLKSSKKNKLKPNRTLLLLLRVEFENYITLSKTWVTLEIASRSAADIVAKPFLLITSTAGSVCPHSMSYGAADQPPVMGSVPGFDDASRIAGTGAAY